MKILMALNGLDIGGAETHVVELSKEIVRRGHQVIMVSSGGVYQKEVEEAGIKHYTVTLTSRSPASIFSSKVQLKKIIQSEKPDIVHSHARIPGFLLDMVHKEMKSFVFVSTAHWTFDTSFMVKNLTRWGQKTLAVSEDIKKYLLKYYPEVKESNIYISINGIDGGKFSKATDGSRVAREFNLTPDAKKIVYVSRLNPAVCAPAYGLIEKIKKLDQAISGIEVIIVGGGDCFEDMRRKADYANAMLGRRAVIMAGPRTDINEIHANADVCVGVSRAILEPMKMEKKCVVVGQEGYIGILTPAKLETAIKCNFTCRGCAPLDNEIMTDDIIRLFQMDEAQAKEVTDYGKWVVEQYYSVKKMADDNMNMYYDAIRDNKKTVMLGYYGYGNSGDDALLGSIISDIKEVMPDFAPIVLSHDVQATQRAFGVECADRFNIKQVTDAFKRSNVLLLGGGSLIQDVTSTKSLLYYLWCIKLAKKFGLKVMLYANGIGPIVKEENKKRAAKVLETVDIITLRDEESAEFLTELGVTKPQIVVTADPAFSFGGECEDISGEFGIEGDYVCMSVRNWPDADAKVLGGIAQMCDYIVSNYSITPVFVPMQFEKDLNPAKTVAARMENKSVVIHKKLSVKQIVSLIKHSKAVVSVRLHMLIFGAAAGVPGIGIEYDPKIRGFQNNMELPYLSVKDITTGAYKDIIDSFMTNIDQTKQHLSEIIPEKKKQSKQNALIAAQLIKEKGQ